jgi:hypothetical protein
MNKGQSTGIVCSLRNCDIKIGDKVLFKNHLEWGTYEVEYGKIRILTDDWKVDWYAYCPHIKWEDGNGGLAITEDNVYWAGE